MSRLQEICKRIVIIGSIMSLSLTCVGITARAGRTMDEIPDLMDEQILPLVQESFENYKSRDAVCYTLEASDGWSFIGYDFKNKVGVLSTYYNDDPSTYREGGLDNAENSWYDYKARIAYNMSYDDRGKEAYYVSPIAKKEIKDHINEYFSDLLTIKEEAFPIAEKYTYAGKELVYTPNNETHICYRLEIPYSDESLYLDEGNYLPTAVYIGVDDKQVYRIDEERIVNSYMDYSIREYHTYFSYPEKIEVPGRVKKRAVLDSDYEYRSGGVVYSPARKGKCFMVFSYDYNSKKKNIKIRDTVTVLGKKIKVDSIDFRAFTDIKKLKSLTFGKNIKRVWFQAFLNCKNLKRIKINKGLKVIEDGVFKNCSSLKELTFPDSVKSIGKNAFKGCKSLKTITVKNKKLREYLLSDKGRKKTAMPSGVVVK